METAKQYIDLQFKKLELEAKELIPVDYVPKTDVDYARVLTRDLDEAINERIVLIEDLRVAVQEELKANLTYDHKYDNAMLHTNFTEELDKAKPTVDEKKAHVRSKLADLYDNKKITSDNVSNIRRQIETVDNRISSEKLKLRLILKQ